MPVDTLPVVESALSIDDFKTADEKASDTISSREKITIGTDCSGIDVAVMAIRNVVQNVQRLFSSASTRTQRGTHDSFRKNYIDDLLNCTHDSRAIRINARF